jgi:gamma-glutamyltranspeptidase/glutathione hydrolase
MGVPSSGPGSWAGRSFREGVVAASHPLAAQAGALVLERGGNAIDAAATIQFVLNVVEPQYSGIGGGLFMLVHSATTETTIALDARERAPAAATPAMFVFPDVPAADRFKIASTSGISVGVPGAVLGIATALSRFGTIPLADAIAPAAELADNGFAINEFLAADIVNDGGRTSLQPETAAIFRPGGTPLKEGDRLVQKDLARALRLIARDGPDAFYRGEIAAAIVAAQARSRTSVSAAGAGRMTPDDLRQYNVVVRTPVRGRYRGLDVVSMPPPSSGGLAVLQALAMLERFPLADDTKGFGFASVGTLHVTIEALRLAFADRAVWMGDADFVPVPVKGLLAAPYVQSRSAMIDPHRRMPMPAAGDPRKYDSADAPAPLQLAIARDDDHRGYTTHFTVADKWGNVVAVTSTIEARWGTGITVPGYGVLLNNELTDFNLEPMANANPDAFNPGANDVAPGKRPRSSMAPTIMFRDGAPIAAYGSPGGATIIGSVLQVTNNLVDHSMLMQDAIDSPRIAVTSASGDVDCEGPAWFMVPRIEVAVQDALRQLGHPMPGEPGGNGCTASIGSVQGVLQDPVGKRQYGGADLRREGTVIGLPRPR